MLLAWQPHSYSLRIIEATQQAIITKECNQRQIELIPPNPLCQEQLELAVITRDTTTVVGKGVCWSRGAEELSSPTYMWGSVFFIPPPPHQGKEMTREGK